MAAVMASAYSTKTPENADPVVFNHHQPVAAPNLRFGLQPDPYDDTNPFPDGLGKPEVDEETKMASMHKNPGCCMEGAAPEFQAQPELEEASLLETHSVTDTDDDPMVAAMLMKESDDDMLDADPNAASEDDDDLTSRLLADVSKELDDDQQKHLHAGRPGIEPLPSSAVATPSSDSLVETKEEDTDPYQCSDTVHDNWVDGPEDNPPYNGDDVGLYNTMKTLRSAACKDLAAKRAAAASGGGAAAAASGGGGGDAGVNASSKKKPGYEIVLKFTPKGAAARAAAAAKLALPVAAAAAAAPAAAVPATPPAAPGQQPAATPAPQPAGKPKPTASMRRRRNRRRRIRGLGGRKVPNAGFVIQVDMSKGKRGRRRGRRRSRRARRRRRSRGKRRARRRRRRRRRRRGSKKVITTTVNLQFNAGCDKKSKKGGKCKK